MTKLVNLLVTVAVDDEVRTEDGIAACQAHLETLPVQRVGPADPESGDPADRTGPNRIHWSSVHVRRLVERSPQPAAAGTKPRKRTDQAAT